MMMMMTMGCFNWSRKKKKKASMASRPLGKRWRDLSGRNHWKDALEPLDLELRQYIIHYGEMAQATYDTFNANTKSKYAGSSIYSRQDFFSKVGLEKGHPYCKYQVTKFLYSTSQISVPDSFLVFPVSREGWTKESNWIGYVAVATDQGKQVLGRRDIVVAWRGTIQTLEWINDFDFGTINAKKIFGDNGDGVGVHQGWYSIYTSEDERSPFNKASARDQVLREIRRLVEKYKDEEISITICGHSLGAALSTLSAADIVANGYNRPKNLPDKSCPVTVFAFASPRVGDSDFKRLFSGLDDLRALRIRNLPDVVPIYPPIGYSEVGEELVMDTRKSPYLKSPGNPTLFHTMEVYLHGIAGTRGTKSDFKLEIERDIALVNKPIDGLKDEFMVPGSWRALKNKGMAQQNDGSWKLMDHETDDNEDVEI
ncbi:PREDICTED: phospholipase A1-IIgamma-like [Tarenaya hassleriana]|uniref:phospholipase A1-IIgamma-like n=1 Tax=Tarenaya hassleriana TaxID=28532 RepID=UPI00053C5E8A|nr:PREDICTED: phospholipase A1-IIgamma-like [Tarenaya hassleriana]XP_010529191.1 PREDICTED: phospholipase A1-IIgamma-like [Tarenaya hassleriana]